MADKMEPPNTDAVRHGDGCFDQEWDAYPAVIRAMRLAESRRIIGKDAVAIESRMALNVRKILLCRPKAVQKEDRGVLYVTLKRGKTQRCAVNLKVNHVALKASRHLLSPSTGMISGTP